MSKAEWDDVIAVNLTGPFLAAREFAAGAIGKEKDGAVMVNISSSARNGYVFITLRLIWVTFLRFILPRVGLATRAEGRKAVACSRPLDPKSTQCPKGFHHFGCVNKIKPCSGRLFSRVCPRLLRGQWRVIPIPRLK